jgi:hypothetical protein
MARDHFLMYALCGVVLINVIAIMLLNNQLAARERAEAPLPPKAEPIRTQPSVRTLVIQDKVHCPDCFDLNAYATELEDTILMRVEQVDAATAPTFSADILPAIAFNATLEEYPALIEGWELGGTVVTIPDGQYAGKWYVLPSQNAPRYSQKERRVLGRVTVTYLTLDSCTECYDVFITRGFLNDSRITVHKEIIVDAESSQGKALVARYNISALPTILMDDEADAYPNIGPGWEIMGTIEQDGTYTLRELQRLNVPYYDLQRKKLMKP